MIADTINKKIAEAMKARDEVRLSTLRMLSSALNYEKINKQHDLTDEEETTIVRKEAKKRKDAIEAYEKAGANDRAAKETEELQILQEYLPPDMSDEELEKEVDVAITQLGVTSMVDMGKVIGSVKSKVGAAVDGARVAEIVKSKLSK